MAVKEYTTVRENVENTIEIRRSVFITSVARVEDADDADAFVRGVKKKFPDATHNCYAYIAGAENPVSRFSDDGEPGGTAGQPMLEVLKKKGLNCVAAVVTRYFGGVKLGAGGLVSAYTESVAEAVEKAGTVTMKKCLLYSVGAAYQDFARIDGVLARFGARRTSVEYADAVSAVYAVPEEDGESFVETLKAASAGGVGASSCGSLYLPFDGA